MRLKPQEFIVEYANEPPAEPTPEQLRFFGQWIADLHIARMQAAAAVQSTPDTVEAATCRAAASILMTSRTGYDEDSLSWNTADAVP